ncbi:NUDIX hydrolase [Chitinophaga ginsengisoli]|uniref:NUDIX domain-containing protein n=1 Tax=Chitinophaga ginsengisoli TaxID=363837 RepID=A0A2P8FNU7_9BACT|nr:NUDIX domain-containing protein [Chitinophaga ginsengisoli]PSL23387.1 NUDIX domain-containing protein [Chitinophaga ginsengisoli]
MDEISLFEERSKEFYKDYLPHVSIDCVVFGFHSNTLKVLLIRMKGQEHWGLPGGYVGKDEHIDDAAIRILKSRTGAEKVFLEQFKAFGNTGRSEKDLSYLPESIWFRQRFISVGYYALVDYEQIIPVVDDISTACEWKSVHELPAMMMDHRQIYEAALENMRFQLNYKPIGYNLLPEEFTMPDLQKLYETILGKPLSRSNFQRKMLAYDIFIKHDKERKGGAHRSPILYSFDQVKYQAALKTGLKEAW